MAQVNSMIPSREEPITYEILTSSEVCELLRCGRHALYRLMRAEHPLPVVGYLNSRPRFLRVEILQWLRETGRRREPRTRRRVTRRRRAKNQRLTF